MVKVLAGTEFKLRHTDTALGYFWSLARPLGLFAVLYVVFGQAFRLDALVPNYPIFLLLGLVLFFFSEATTRTMTSIVEQSHLLRRLAFPPLILVIAVSITAFINFSLSGVALRRCRAQPLL